MKKFIHTYMNRCVFSGVYMSVYACMCIYRHINICVYIFIPKIKTGDKNTKELEVSGTKAATNIKHNPIPSLINLNSHTKGLFICFHSLLSTKNVLVCQKARKNTT